MDKQLKNPLIRKIWPPIRDLGPHVKKRFLVDFRPYGRKYFFKVGEAKAFADAKAAEAKSVGDESLKFPTELRVETIKAIRRLRPFNATITDAVEFFVAHREQLAKANGSPTVADAVTAYVTAREVDFGHGRLKRRSLQEIKSRMNQLKAAFSGFRICDLNTARLQQFIDALPMHPRSKRNVRVHAGTFLNWCIEQQWLNENPVTKTRLRLPELDIQILSVDEAAELLKAASREPDLLAFTAIGLFAGCRVNEIHQMMWKDVDVETRAIHVSATASKLAKQRFVDLNDTLLAFIAPIHEGSGKITKKNFRSRWRKMLGKMKLPQNVLRHSCASYMIPIHGRVHTAEQLGNSPQVLAQHYRRPLPMSVAQQYWALRPHP